MDERSIFLQAIEKPVGERSAWLRQICGGDPQRQERIEALFQRHEQANSFLEQPAPELEATMVRDLEGVLHAGLAPAFTEDAAVVVGNLNHSVLKALGKTLGKVTSVSLREFDSDPVSRPSSPEVPTRQPDSRYQLQGEIARGGMGAIIKGRDTDLGRELAIKVLLDEHKAKPEVIQRFVEEAQIGGQLQHPGIAPVYELGQFADQRPFFSMKLVKGKTLARLLTERENAGDDRGRFLGIFEQVCQTMAYAHSRGVIHRDLKPANIMVGAFGEVQVMDWGLAKVLPSGGVADERASRHTEGTSLVQTLRNGVGSGTSELAGSSGSSTQMGSVMGTPAYMAPEQALGATSQLDERSDVFGLGAILCEILTGDPPYIGDDGPQVFRRARLADLEPCHQRLDACGADRELVAIAKRALELEPADRPRDAGVLTDWVTAYIESVEVKLRESELELAAQTARADAEAAQAKAERQRAAAEADRAREENRRRRTSLALAASILLLVVLGSGGWLYIERQNANRNADHAVEMGVLAAQEKAARDESERQLYAHRINAAHVEWEMGNLTRFSNLLDESVADRAPGFAWQILNGFREQQNPRAEFGTPREISCFAIDRRGERVAVGLQNGEIRLRGLDHEWSDSILKDDDESTQWSEVTKLAFSADGRRLLATGGKPKSFGELRIWDLSLAKQTTIKVSREAAVSASAIHPTGDWAATYDENDRLRVWDCRSGESIWGQEAVFGRQSQDTRQCRLAISSADDRSIVACSTWNGIIRLWDLETGEQLEGLSLGTTVFGIAFSPTGDRLATASDREVRIWDIREGKPTKLQKVTWDRCQNLEFSADGTKLVTTNRNGAQLAIWDISDSRRLARFLHPFGRCHASLSADGKRLYSAAGRKVCVWDVDRSKEKISAGSAHWMVPLAISRDSRYVAVGGAENSVVVWDISTGESRTIRHGTASGERAHEARVRCLDLSADGRYLYSGAIDGPSGESTVRIFDLEDNSEFQVRAVPGQISAVSCSADGQHFATAAEGGNLQLWSISREEPHLLRKTPGAILCMKFSPDGSRFAVGGDVFAWEAPEAKPGLVEVWEVTGERPKSLRRLEHGDGAWSLDWSADGETLATAKTDGGLALWDLESGKKIKTFPASGWITSIGLSPDGKTLAACGPVVGVVRFWETESGQEVAAFRVQEKCRKLAFLPNGDGLVLSSIEGITRHWRAAPPAK